MRVNHYSFDLTFKYPFTISKGTKTEQPTLIVALEMMGLTGFGEAPAISYYQIPVEQMIKDLESKRLFIEKFAFTEPERYWHYLHHLFPDNSFLVCALDMAGWDLFGKIKKKPLYELWNLDPQKTITTDYTIGIDSIEKMISKIDENPWPIYKIKLGTGNDLDIMYELRKNTKSVFRVDVNGAWNLIQALERIPVLKELGVEFIEQPLAKDDWQSMKILFEKSPLPLIADESCVYENDLQKCLGHFHGINIKLTKCGGITPARRMVAEARKSGMKIMLGSMNESSIGSAALAHLSPLADWLDMDGPLLLSRDIARGLVFASGRPMLNNLPGLGVDYIGWEEGIVS
jgi:L-alanine-DL-glutamate epimerase-like enolase superfamily enzyme